MQTSTADSPGPLARNMERDEGRGADKQTSLSDSLNRLTLAAASANGDSALPMPSSNSHAQTLRGPSSPSSVPGAARRQSASPSAAQASFSPAQSRRASAQNITPAKPSFRRASSMKSIASATDLPPCHPHDPQVRPQVDFLEVTAVSVAKAHFENELRFHTTNAGSLNTDTVVIIHDACYGHRFSRPKTSKVGLSLIVERPERIQACASGIAAAYVRLGARFPEARHEIHPRKGPSNDVPFRIKRSSRLTSLTSPAVTSVHGTKWMQELTAMCNTAAEKLAAGGKELSRPETPSGSASKQKLHEGDLYLCKESLSAFQGALGGVLDGVDAIFGPPSFSNDGLSSLKLPKKAFVCVRPPGHHCSADLPSGFCWLNNVHVGIEYAAQNYGLTHAAIVDFDLHHGDGSQAITWERNARVLRMPKNTPQSKKTSIGYFSLHDINSYPCEYGDQEKVQNASLCLENAHNQTIWNVHLQPWKTEAEFWELYETRYTVLLEKAGDFLRKQSQRISTSSPNVQPKSAIFISAGFDASEWEGEGMQRHKVNVPTEFYARFTQDITELSAASGTGVDGRVISVLEGGYSDRALTSGVFSHLSGLVMPEMGPAAHPLRTSVAQEPTDTLAYDKEWWSSSMLDELESLIHPVIPQPPKKTRISELSTYATPTQSFTAKVVDPSKVYRSLSGVGPQQELSRPPTPPPQPPPRIDWATATHELSKLLVPSDRQTDSYRYEELAGSRTKRERRSTAGVAAESGGEKKMQLRGRKAKLPNDPESMTSDGMDLPVNETSGPSRRRTISELPSALDAGRTEDRIQRPSTSDSKTVSEEFVATDGRSGEAEMNRDKSPKRLVKDAAKVHRTRRASGAKAELLPEDLNAKPPPVPKLPPELNATSRNEPAKLERLDSTNSSIGLSDIDRLANGVKKITLRMPSKEPLASSSVPKGPLSKSQRKAPVPRASSKATAPKLPISRTSKGPKPVAPLSTTSPSQELAIEDIQTHAQKSGAVNEAEPLPGPNTAAMASAIQPPPRELDTTAENQAEGFVPLPSQTRRTGQVLAHHANGGVDMREPVRAGGVHSRVAQQPNIASKAFDGFISCDPSAQYSAADVPQQTSVPDSLTWLPPNTSTPAQTPVKQGKENLPVFTSSGFIPFAPTHTSRTDEKRKVADGTTVDVKEGTNVWDVPDTPKS